VVAVSLDLAKQVCHLIIVNCYFVLYL
jgi:hypothetical protein